MAGDIQGCISKVALHYVGTLTGGEIIRMFNGSIEFEWLKVRFSPIIACYIEQA